MVLGVGRLTEQKDFPTLLRAFAEVATRRDARLIILGEGQLRETLLEQAQQLGIADKVAFPGFTDNPWAWMHRAAVFVLSSRWEGSPNTLTEALALGTPVVSTDCPSGPRELLSGGEHCPAGPDGRCRRIKRGHSIDPLQSTRSGDVDSRRERLPPRCQRRRLP